MTSPPETPMNGPAQSRPDIVVIGAGFGGINVVRGLANQTVNVTIVDQNNFHTFLPLLYQVATAGLEPTDVAYPVRTIFGKFKNVHFRHGRVTGIDHERQVVRLHDGSELRFDHLVFAGGAAASYFAVPGAKENSLALYTLSDARRLRNHLLLELEAADARSTERLATFTVVVVGGGPTGVETAGAVVELLEVCERRDGLRIDPVTSKVVLIDVAAKLLNGFPDSASQYAEAELRRKGVDIRLGTSVVGVDAEGVDLANGERIISGTVVWAGGVTAVGTVAQFAGDTAGPSGRVRVTPDLRIEGRSNEWAIGDGSAILASTPETYLPQLAPVAIQSGRHCARQILRVINGESTEPFSYRDKGVMATIGRHSAVARVSSRLVVKGVLGWLAWLALHLYYLIGFRNRIRVLINWTWRYFDWPSGPRLIITDDPPETKKF
jgi:NADH dehydrogenase